MLITYFLLVNIMIVKKKLNRFINKLKTEKISKKFRKINCIYPMTFDEALARQNARVVPTDLTCIYPLQYGDALVYSMAYPYATIAQCNRAIAFLSHKITLLKDFNRKGDHDDDPIFIKTMDITTKMLESLKVDFYEFDEYIRLDQLIFQEVNDLMLGNINITDASLRTAQYIVQNQNSHLLFEDVIFDHYGPVLTYKLYFGRLRMDYYVAEACAEAQGIIKEEVIEEKDDSNK